MGIDDKKVNVLVTGAARGIGEAVALGLAARGYHVFATDLNKDGLQTTVEEGASRGWHLASASADLTDEAAARRLVSRVVDELGSLDGLVHVAGGTNASRVDYFDITAAEFRSMIDRNLTSAFIIGQACAREMVTWGSGSIVLTSSIGAHFAFPGLAHYGAAKGGVQQLVRCMALELGPRGVRVNAIAPGSFLTPGNREFMDGTPAAAAFVARTPAGRLGGLEETVGAVAFLLSDDASYTTASTVMLDGGYTIG
jgi:gluconate 5-dehydrogenase